MIAIRSAQAAAVVAVSAVALLLGATATLNGDLGRQAAPTATVAADLGWQAPPAGGAKVDLGWQ
ncbi:hypothetical protein [Streptomyces bambusae]|uniref:Uncharacterized protein n=1 Tax=Streptomyces bambusae TaxID=1550616 RepID=A0ABS6Z426_9ACTN|nr:hypothetical protein [Streptomyces bambusae]MBW5482326.1 hypothetical protein [Streptomyces bambusae]